MLSWITSLWKSGECKQLTVGTRVKTPHGPGVVKSGCVNVYLDKGFCKQNHENDRSVTHSFDKIEII